MVTNGVSKYFLQDHLGSTAALTNSSGSVIESATYDSFGNATGNLSTRYQFTGREYDNAIGLTYYRARWYSSELGRFVSEDPIGFGGGDVNLFGYVGNNPQNYVDPSGNQRADRDRPGDQYPGMREPYNPNKNTSSKGGSLSCDLGNYNPWIGGEVGGSGHLIYAGLGISGGIEINPLTGEICLFTKVSPRVGLGAFAGVGAKLNLDLQQRSQPDGTTEQPELGLDLAVADGGHVNINGGKFVREPLRKLGFSGDGSSSGVGIGIGPELGVGGAIGLDLTKKRVWCFNRPDGCPCQ
jgi:RHS repeat-associated protein